MSGFYDYFLKAQREGYEIYIGEDIALAVYEEDKTIGIQSIEERAVFCSYDQLGDLVDDLAMIRNSENRHGLDKNISPRIWKMWAALQYFHDYNDPSNQPYEELLRAQLHTEAP